MATKEEIKAIDKAKKDEAWRALKPHLEVVQDAQQLLASSTRDAAPAIKAFTALYPDKGGGPYRVRLGEKPEEGPDNRPIVLVKFRKNGGTAEAPTFAIDLESVGEETDGD